MRQVGPGDAQGRDILARRGSDPRTGSLVPVEWTSRSRDIQGDPRRAAFWPSLEASWEAAFQEQVCSWMAALRETWLPVVHFMCVRCWVGPGKGSQFTQTQAQAWEAGKSWEMLSERCQEDWGRGALRPSRSIFIPPSLHTPGRVTSSCGLRPLTQCDHTSRFSCSLFHWPPNPAYLAASFVHSTSCFPPWLTPALPSPADIPPISLGFPLCFHHWRQQRLSSMRRKKPLLAFVRDQGERP